MHPDLLQLQRYHDSGDAGAFQVLVRHHAGMVFATARRITQDASLAEDVAQETFLELARKGRSITESVGGWLHRVAWRRACDVVRAKVARQQHETAASQLQEGREATWEELEPVLDEALESLMQDERTALIEHYLEGRTQTEIASRLGISQSSVSRLLNQGLTQLRTQLKARRVLCGAALAAMLGSNATASAAPASLVMTLHKMALSSVGSQTALAGGGSALGLKLKTFFITAAVLIASAAGYDLASVHSLLMRWFSAPASIQKEPSPTAPRDKTVATPGSSAARSKEQLLAEARAIWERVPRLSEQEVQRLTTEWFAERDPEKAFIAMWRLGIRMSRTSYDRVVARHPGVFLFDERRAGESSRKLGLDLLNTWFSEAPREATAWAALMPSSSPLIESPVAAAWVRDHPEEWAAFVEAGSDPKIADRMRLWVEELDDPGSIWSKAKAAGMTAAGIQQGIYISLESGAPVEMLYRQIMRCPEDKQRSEFMVALASRLSAEQLHQVVNSGLFPDAGLMAVLSLMAGNTSASIPEASAWLTKAANGGGNEAQLARWTEGMAGRFYAAWVQLDARAAIRHAVSAQNPLLLEKFMESCGRSPALSESMIAAAFSSPVNRARALAAYYQANAGNDPRQALQSILNSSVVEDQITTARHVIEHWAVSSAAEAGAWAAALPPGDGRDELLATVASQWAEVDAEAAFAFAREQGISLAHGWANGFAWGARALPEEKLTAIFAQLRSDPDFNRMLARLISVRYPGDPQKGMAMLSQHAHPGWQKLIVDDTISWLEHNDGRADDYALQLPALDLTQVDPAKINNVAQLLVKRLVNDGKAATALDWTQKLPASLAAPARNQALAALEFSNEKQRLAVTEWLRRSSLPEAERTSLLRVVSKP